MKQDRNTKRNHVDEAYSEFTKQINVQIKQIVEQLKMKSEYCGKKVIKLRKPYWNNLLQKTGLNLYC